MTAATIRVERRRALGIIVLDRPRALNALTPEMVEAFSGALASLAEDAAVTRVLVRSASPGAFCAGGDVRLIRELVLHGRLEEADAFFRTEFALNLQIARFPKPYVALIDGVCFGGGLGLSVHGRYRLVTERAVLSMPETLIGYFTDIGATYVLPRLPPGIGLWLGLTGARFDGAQSLRAGLATHGVTSASAEGLIDDLGGDEPVEQILDRAATKAIAARPIDAEDEIGRHFTRDNAGAVLRSLERCDSTFARHTLAVLRMMCPRSLDVTAALIAQGASSTLEDCLARELDTAKEMIRHRDFAEGVRALLVDKDRKPRWAGVA